MDFAVFNSCLYQLDVNRRRKKWNVVVPTVKKRKEYVYDSPYKLPDLKDCMTRHEVWGRVPTDPYILQIDSVLRAYGISYNLDNVTQGCTITRITITLNDLKDYNKALKLEKVFSAALDVSGIRVAQSGRLLSIEIPIHTNTLRIGDLLTENMTEGLKVPIGQCIDGTNKYADIVDLRHMLIAGASGSGKSVFMQGLIVSLLSGHDPSEIELYMVDPKMVEFSFYRNLGQCRVFTETADAVNALKELTELMDARYRTFSRYGCRDIDDYNAKFPQKLRRIVLCIDELADLVMTSKRKVEDYIVRLAQKARAAGIHMIIATQYPTRNVVTGLIRANIPTKVCFAVPDSTASRVVIGRGGAEKLIGKGDMLYMTEKDLNPIRIQAGLIETNEINNIVYQLMSNQREV